MNILSPENYIESINSYTEQDWKPLFELIPEIKKLTNSVMIQKH